MPVIKPAAVSSLATDFSPTLTEGSAVSLKSALIHSTVAATATTVGTCTFLQSMYTIKACAGGTVVHLHQRHVDRLTKTVLKLASVLMRQPTEVLAGETRDATEHF